MTYQTDKKKMKQTRKTLLTLSVTAALLSLLTSCNAFMHCGHTCTCTHKGPCICCNMPVNPDGTLMMTAPVIEQQTLNTDKALLDSLLNADYSLEQIYVEPEAPKAFAWVDDSITVTIDELLPYFAISNGRYTPRGVSFDNSDNEFFVYFEESPEGIVGPLHLRVQYYADDPLYFNELMVIVEGWEYHFTPATTPQRGKSGKFYWENSDEPLKATDKDFIYALAHGSWAYLHLLGAGGMDHITPLTEKQLQDFQRTLALYRLKGGVIQ